MGRPIEFKLEVGSGKIIKGWEEGLKGMCVGELRRLTVPSKLGYGDEGKSATVTPIPGGERRSYPLQQRSCELA